MAIARIVVDSDFRIGQVDPRLYGAFVEHLGRAVYGGIYEPGHPAADEMGFRGDVLALVRELGVPFVRYRGGNFVSGHVMSRLLIAKAIRTLRSAEPTNLGADEMLDEMLERFQTVDAAPPPEADISTRVEHIRSLVEKFRSERVSAGT